MRADSTREASGASGIVERVLWTVGALCLSWCLFVLVQGARYQAHARAAVAHLGEAGAPPASQPSSGPSSTSQTAPPPLINDLLPGDPPLVGLLEVPRLGLSVGIAEGDDDTTLNAAGGHLSDTPMPWEAGNSGIAAHRDRHFRPLKDVRVGDSLTMKTARGRLKYRVSEIVIVTPQDVWVLDPTTKPTLTLITCYPFNYVGKAPKRFIVRAERLSDATTRTGG